MQNSPKALRSPCLLLLSLIVGCHGIADARLDSATSSDSIGGSFEEHLGAAQPLEGLLDLFVDERGGKAWLALPVPAESGVSLRLLYAEGLTTGLGSNPVGLDRGQIGSTRVLAFRVVGSRVLVEVENLRYRARTDNQDEQRATDESFASSVLWSGEVASFDDQDRALVDFTSFLVRDAHGVAETLASTGQGNWSLDKDGSVFDGGASLSFPDNVELEAILTFRGQNPGRQVRATAALPDSITLVQHHSFIRLPDEGYRSRPHDPRLGANAVRFADYAAPLGTPLDRALAIRHRLNRKNAEDPNGGIEEPIVYYLDRGTPEPVRGALFDGARWWEEAFEAAGFPGGFRVELLPAAAHPLDVRYNVIEWVHRSTRGWSYGGGIVDPRTGEMVKGHVSLGSLRVRQDQRIFEGLLGVDATGSGGPEDPIQLALARIRQLSAHEVGHTLGLAHNFAASTYGDRASVMDYPAPLVRLEGDGLGVGEAYGVGVGGWDVHAIRALYEYSGADESESEFLDRFARDAMESGQLFLSDADARPAGAAHPLANLWDNGADPVRELERVLEVRQFAIDHFGARNLAAGRPLAELQEVFVPIYFFHRYQVDAALKTIGGFTYRHALAEDGREPIAPVPASTQRAALGALLSVVDPERLDIPEPVLRTMLPRPPGQSRNREMFPSDAEPGVDPVGIAAAAAGQVFAGLLQSERLNRLADFERRGSDVMGLAELVEALSGIALQARRGSLRLEPIEDAVRSALVEAWIRAVDDERLTASARAPLTSGLEALVERLAPAHPALARDIVRFMDRPWAQGEAPRPSPTLPPGSPIGIGGPEGLPFVGCGHRPLWLPVD